MEKEIGKCNCGNETTRTMKFMDSWMYMCEECCHELLELLGGE
jgi:hypothetical protein